MTNRRIYLFHQAAHLRDAIQRDLVQAGFAVRPFGTGEGLEAALLDEAPDAVLWDIDAADSARVIRLSESVEAPFVHLTCFRSEVAGLDGEPCLVMPFERFKVADLVTALLVDTPAPAARSRSRTELDASPLEQPHLWGIEAPDFSALIAPIPEHAESTEPPDAPVRVLVADDDDVLQHILAYQFLEAGWQVTRAHDGVTASDLLARENYDLVLLDLNLPHRNGFEILETVAPRDQVDGARMVVISEQTQDDKVIRAFSLGAHDFVQKPLNPRVVLSRFQRLLERS